MLVCGMLKASWREWYHVSGPSASINQLRCNASSTPRGSWFKPKKPAKTLAVDRKTERLDGQTDGQTDRRTDR